METLEIIGIVVSVVAGMKALDYIIEKINKTHDKSQLIDSNAETLGEYIDKTDKRIADMEKRINDAHTYATNSLNQLEKNISKAFSDTMDDHKKEYIKRIESVEQSLNQVENSITQMSAVYQQTVAVVDVKIENLTKQVEKHNSVVERTFLCEKKLDVQEEQIRVANHRLKTLENKNGRISDDDDGK